jgi:hypothetical protein
MVDAHFSVGNVISVSGTRIVGQMRSGSDSPDVSVGMLVKAPAGKAHVFGIISGLKSEPARDGLGEERRIFEIDLLGETIERHNGTVQTVFQRGVSSYPVLNAEILAASENDYALVYNPPEGERVAVGTVFHSNGLPAYLMIDDLLGKHFAILGTTGTGKSCTVALILRRILSEHPNGHVILLDPHNEYATAFGDMAELVNTDNLKLPHWLLSGEEMASILIGRKQDANDPRGAILNAAILKAKKDFLGREGSTTNVTVDTPTPYQLTKLVSILDDATGRLEKPEGSLPYMRLKSRIEALRSDVRYSFMFSGLVVQDVITDVVSRLMRAPVDGRPITIVDLSAVPSEITDTVVSVLCRLIFDFCLWSEPVQALPVLLVCEEAHRYIPEGDGTGFEPSKKILSRIAKEGRKYGVSLGLVSQRPSELSASILSQCSTLFALRMSNEKDQEYVFNALPENASGFLTALSSLRTQEAIAVGEGVSVPMRLMFDDLPEEHRPRSSNALFSRSWKKDEFTRGRVNQIVNRWRNQTRHIESPRPVPKGPDIRKPPTPSTASIRKP